MNNKLTPMHVLSIASKTEYVVHKYSTEDAQKRRLCKEMRTNGMLKIVHQSKTQLFYRFDLQSANSRRILQEARQRTQSSEAPAPLVAPDSVLARAEAVARADEMLNRPVQSSEATDLSSEPVAAQPQGAQA